MSGSQPFRSAVPLAAVGIACLGLTPTFGGPEQPLHWAMTAGMVGFGALLWLRHRVVAHEGVLAAVPLGRPRQVAHTLLILCGLIAVLVAGIVSSRALDGKPIAVLSVAMPVVGWLWLLSVALRIRQLAEAPAESNAGGDRPSRRPPKRDSRTPPLANNQGEAASNRHASL